MSVGTTPSEQYLSKLCKQTFLSLWSYPNIFRDQKVRGKGDGKELCDLLVVSGRDIIIFSDKSCEFPNTGNLTTDWSRWFQRTIKKSVDQLFGAKRWIQGHPDRLFIDRSCKKPFPLLLPEGGKFQFHLIAIANGAKARCQEEMGGSGSLVLFTEILADNHLGKDCRPFYIGDVDPKRDFVHVLDEVTLDIIMKELDTITDFVGYLREKVSFIRSNKKLLAEGEENLLAYYLSNMKPNGGHGIVLTGNYQNLHIEDGHWKQYVCSADVSRKKTADKKSYVWDELIEEFIHHAVNGTLMTESGRSISDTEKALRVIALESRFRRRVLAEAFFDLIETASKEKSQYRTVFSEENPALAYVFLTVPELTDKDEYRRKRRVLLESYCHVLAWKHNLHTIIGISTEPDIKRENRSFDHLYYEPPEWTDEAITKAQWIQENLNILHDKNLVKRPFNAKEYPSPSKSIVGEEQLIPISFPLFSSQQFGRPHRNSQCPCGSGKKYKQCCMRR